MDSELLYRLLSHGPESEQVFETDAVQPIWSKEEHQIVLNQTPYPEAIVLVARSGTCKTTAAIARMSMNAQCEKRQVFITQSPSLQTRVKRVYHRLMHVPELEHSMEFFPTAETHPTLCLTSNDFFVMLGPHPRFCV